MASKPIAAFSAAQEKRQKPSLAKAQELIKQSSADAALQEFKFKEFNISNSMFDANEAAYQLDRLLNGEIKKMSVYDVETVGDVITELAYVDYDMIDGVPVEKGSKSIVLGLYDNGSVMDEIDAAINKLKKNPSALNAKERSVLQRLSLFSGNFDDRFESTNEGLVVKSHAESRPLDYDAIASGKTNLLKANKSIKGKEREILENYVSHLNAYSLDANGAVGGFNTTGFDNGVINNALKSFGSSSGLSSRNQIDFYNTYRLQTKGNPLGLLAPLANQLEVGLDEINFKNETLMRLVNPEAQAHLAIDDVRGTVNAMFFPMKDGENQVPLIKSLGPVSASNVIGSNGDAVVHSVNALRMGPLDTVEQFIDGSFSKREYGNYATKRGHFYNINELRFVDPGTIAKNKDLIVELKRAGYSDEAIGNGLWMMQLESAASEGIGIKERVTLFRENKAEFQKIFQKEMMIKAVGVDTQKSIDLQTAAHVADNSRRSYSGIFETGSRGFSYAEEMYGAYETLRNELASRGFTGTLSNQDVKDFMNGKEIAGLKFSDIKDKMKFKSIERQMAFGELYNVLNDNNVFMTRAIKTINQEAALSKDPYANSEMRKTMALRKTRDNAIEWAVSNELAVAKSVANNGKVDLEYLEKDLRDQLLNRTHPQENWTSGSIIQVSLNDKIHSIQVGNSADTTSSIKRLLSSIVDPGSKHSPVKLEAETHAALNRVVESIKTQHPNLLPSDYVLNSNEAYSLPTPETLIAKLENDIRLHSRNESFIINPNMGFNLSGHSIYGQTFDQYFSLGFNVEQQAKTAFGSVQYFGQFDASSDYDHKKGFSSIRDEIRDVLKNTYNYTDENVSSLSTILYSDKGLIKQHGLAAVLFEQDGVLNLGLTKPGNVNDVISMMNRGEDVSSKAAVIKLPKVNLIPGADGQDEIRTIQNGMVERLQSKRASLWYNGPGLDTPRFMLRDTLDEALFSAYRVGSKVALDISNNNFEGAARQFNRAINSILMDEPTATGMGVEFMEDVDDFVGVSARKKTAMNAYDVINATGRFKMGEVVNIIPYLYGKEGNEELTNYIDNNLGYDQKRIYKMMEEWKTNLINGRKSMPTDLAQNMNEFVVSHFIEPNKDMGNKSIMDFVKAQQWADQDTARSMGQLTSLDTSLFSQFAKDEQIADLLVMRKNVVQYVPFGAYNGLNRPLNRQLMSYFVLDPTKFKDNTVSQWAEQTGTRIHSTTMTEEYLNDIAKRFGETHESGITGNTRIMTTEMIMDKLDELFSSDEAVSEFAKQNDIDLDVAKKVVEQYRAHASTFEQHGLVRPTVISDIYNEKELKTMKFDPEFGQDILDTYNSNSNKIYNKGDVIARVPVIKDGNIKSIEEIRYDHHSPGRISFVDQESGTMFIEPTDRQVNAIKMGAGTEKHILSAIGETKEEIKASEAIFSKIAGDTSIAITNPEFAKHYARGSVYGARLSTMAEMTALLAEDTGDQRLLQEFTNIVNDEAPYLKARFEITKQGDKDIARFVISGNPETAQNKKQFSKAVEEIESIFRSTMMKAEIQKQSNKNIMNALIEALDNPNVFRDTLVKMQMSEQHSVADEYGFGKGVKWDQRIQEVTGVGGLDESGAHWMFSNGKTSKRLDPVFEDIWRHIKSTKEYEEAKDSLGNIVNALRGAAGREITAQVKTISTDDLLIHSKNIDDELLQSTIFAGKENGAPDVFELKLRNGAQVKDPLTGKMIDTVYIPRLKAEYVNGQLIATESQRSITGFVDILKQYEDMTLDTKDRSSAQDILDSAYEKMLNRMGFDLSSNKQSMMSQKLLSGRVSYSGQGLSTVIVPAMDQENLERHYFGKGSVEFDDMGKATKAYDYRYISKQKLESMGLSYEMIGRDVVKQGYYAQIDMFTDKAEEFKKLYGSAPSKELFSEIGEKWAKEVGLFSLDTRYPTFRGKSTVVALNRVSDALNGFEDVTMAVTGYGQNLDSDADRKSMIMLLDRDQNRLYGVKKMQEIASEFQTQATENADIWTQLSQNYKKISEHTTGLDEMYLESLHGKHAEMLTNIKGVSVDVSSIDQNLLRDTEARIMAIKANQTKRAIGYVSNENRKLRDVAEAHFKTMASAAKDPSLMVKYSNLISGFTDVTEQKLIDTKHMTALDYSMAEWYTSTMRSVFSSNKEVREEAIKSLTTNERMLKLFGENGSPMAVDAIPLKEIGNILREVGDNEASRQSYFDPRRGSYTKETTGIDKLKIVLEDIDSPYRSNSSIHNQRIAEATSAGVKGLFIDGERVTDSSAFVFEQKIGQVDPGIYKISELKRGSKSGVFTAVLSDINTGVETRLNANSASELQSILKTNSRVIDASDIIVDEESFNLSQRLYKEKAAKMASGFNQYVAEEIGLSSTTGSSIMAEVNQRVAEDIEGGDLKSFLGKTEVMTRKGKMSSSTARDMISQMNEEIKKNGLGAAKTFGDKLLTEGVTSSMEEWHMNKSRVSPTTNVNSFIQSIDFSSLENDRALSHISNIKANGSINLNAIREEILQSASSARTEMSENLIRIMGGESEVDAIISRKVNSLMKKVIDVDNEITKSTRSSYEAIGAINSDSARNFLNWNDISDVDSMRRQKIAFGSFAGKSIGDLSLDQLRGIAQTDITSMTGDSAISAAESQRRILDYMSSLDSAGVDHVRSSVNAGMNASEALTRAGAMMPESVQDWVGVATRRAVDSAENATMFSKAASKVGDVFGDAMGKLSHVGGPGSMVALGAAGAVAAAIMFQQTAKPGPLTPEGRPNGSGDAPRTDGAYEQQSRPVPPPTPPINTKTVRLEEGSGMKYMIKAKGGNVDPSVVSQHIGEATGSQNVNVRMQDDRQSMDESWVERKFAELLN